MADLKEFALKKGIALEKAESSTKIPKVSSKRRPWLGTSLVTNKENKPRTNLEQTENKASTELRTQPSTNLVQTENKLSTNLSFSSLVGLQKKLLLLIYFSIRKNMSNESEQLSIGHLTESSESTIYSVRQTIQRLEKKGFLNRVKFKNGRGGWTIYSLPKIVFQNLLQLETENKVSTEPSTSLSSSSSGDFSLKETTITSEKIMPDDWAKISIPNSLIELGFSPTHIRQIFLSQRNVLQAEEVQSSLHDFEYDIENGHAKPYKGAVNLFLSVLRSKGLPWVSSSLAAAEALEIEKQLKAIELRKETVEKKKNAR